MKPLRYLCRDSATGQMGTKIELTVSVAGYSHIYRQLFAGTMHHLLPVFRMTSCFYSCNISHFRHNIEITNAAFWTSVALLFSGHSRTLYAIAHPSVCRLSTCNAHACYSGGSNFRQYFYGIWYLGHFNFMKIMLGEPLCRGELNSQIQRFLTYLGNGGKLVLITNRKSIGTKIGDHE